MSIRMRWRAASALITTAAAATAVLAAAVPAGASTGPRYASAEQVGYAATGAQFKAIRAEVYLRNPAQYAGESASTARACNCGHPAWWLSSAFRPAHPVRVTSRT
jgi:hypothetical protein